jgi:3-deoxy-manno-octulosonate cytidylyltransferase (CMP-KDO synthetase)
MTPVWIRILFTLYGLICELADWPPSELEKREKLEQLRALEHGVSIGVIVVKRASVGVDAPEDVAKAERALRRGL